jgi:hypothetical protein
MPSYAEKLTPGILLNIASSSISGTYAEVGELLHQARIVKFTNNTNEDVTISWDGTHDHEYIPAGSFLLLDGCANAVSNARLNIPMSTIFYAKGTTGTGNFYISYYYAS